MITVHSRFAVMRVVSLAALIAFPIGSSIAGAQDQPAQKSEKKTGTEMKMEGSKPAEMGKPMEAGKMEGKGASKLKIAHSKSYPLDTCIISGMKLDAKGTPVTKVIDGREVRFCCEGCPEKFAADKEGSFKKLDAAIIAAQKDSYPLEVCPFDGKALGADAVDVVIDNRLVRVCGAGCADHLKGDPAVALTKLDEAVVEKMKADYPLKTCVVSGEPLDGMGEPIHYVYNNELIEFCCNNCKKAFDKEPAKYVEKVHAAAKGGGEAMQKPEAAGEKHEMKMDQKKETQGEMKHEGHEKHM